MSGPHNIKYDKEKVFFNLGRLKTNGEILEVVVDPDLAVEFVESVKSRKDPEMPEVGEPDIREVLKSEDIFHDASKGQLASENFLQQVFNTNDKLKIAERILIEGEIQLTSEHRKRIVDAKYKKIIDIIHRNAVDPTTNLPHPVTRIEIAMENAHIKIEPYKKAEDQVEDVLHKLKPILPIKFDIKQIDLIIFREYAHKVYGVLKKYKVLKESWNSDGSLSMRLEVPAGLRVEFIDKINSMTHGSVEITVLEE